MEDIKSLGIAEYRSVAIGIQAADAMVKAAAVKLIMAQTVCPGKYIIIFSGNLSAVNAALEVATKEPFDTILVGTYCLGNPDPSIFQAIYGLVEKEEVEALGIIEGYTVATTVGAADEIVKTSQVKLIELRLAKGMTGKSYAIFSGEIAAVEASMEKAIKLLKEDGTYLHSSIIPHPDEQIWDIL